MKLSEEWRLYELYYRYHLAETAYPKEASEIERQIIEIYKNSFNKKVTKEDFGTVSNKLKKYANQFKHPKYDKVPLLGPLGRIAFINSSYEYNLDDVNEVHLDSDNFRGFVFSKKSGWISWKLVEGDQGIFKSLSSAFIYLVSKNNHSYDAAFKNMLKLEFKYEDERMSRHIRRFFIDNTFWFHKDLNELFKELPHSNSGAHPMSKFNEWDPN